MHVPFLDRITAPLDEWAVRSQQTSRRNAMIALTALTQRRAELIEVEAYLASLDRAPAPLAVSAANG